MVESTKMSSMERVEFGEKYDRQKLNKVALGLLRLYGSVRRIETLLLGGTPNQVLTKTTVKDFEGAWGDATSGGGDVTDGENLGSGAPVFAGKVDTKLQFKTLLVDGDLELAFDDETVTLIGTGGGGVDPEELADVAFSGLYEDLLEAPPQYLIQTDLSKAWTADEFIRGDNIIGVRQAGATVLLPHDLEIEKIITVKNETGFGGLMVAVY